MTQQTKAVDFVPRLIASLEWNISMGQPRVSLLGCGFAQGQSRANI